MEILSHYKDNYDRETTTANKSNNSILFMFYITINYFNVLFHPGYCISVPMYISGVNPSYIKITTEMHKFDKKIIYMLG